MLKLSGVIFDLDGVLWHSSPAHAAAYARAFGEEGIQLPRGFYNLIAGETTKTGVTSLLKHYASERKVYKGLADRLRKRKQKLAAFELANIEPDPEAAHALQALRAGGYKLALATSASRLTMKLFLQRLSNPEVFDATVCSEDVLRGKPSPDIFVEAAKRLNLAPSDCVVIEDSRSGIRAARACGMFVIGYRLDDLEKDERPLLHYKSLSEVAARLTSRAIRGNRTI